MNKRRSFTLLMVIMILAVATASASGLFPSMDEMLGTAMPSVGLAVGRTADEQAETDSGEQETYLDFSGEDYISFGQYLAACGATVKEYSSEDSTMTATISVRDAEMFFSYDWANRKATAVYPSGTRSETERETDDKGDSILPSVGGVMPSPEFAVGRKPDEQSVSEEGLILTWNTFSDEDYTLFSSYLAETGAILNNSSIEAGVLTAEIGLNGFSFRFVFNWNEQSADAIYPNGTTPESSCWNAPAGSGSILPEIKDLGLELPRISIAIERDPSSTEVLGDGSLQETYLDFSEVDYNIFSQYLQKTGCALDDYHMDKTGVMVVYLSNGSGKMIFTYDALHHTGVAEYPAHTRVERAWVPTPTPGPSATPKPKPTATPKQGPTATPKPDTTVRTTRYTETQCWDIAYNYFMNLRWKNPQSVQVYKHTSSYLDGKYFFTIDYSAANGFGGTNRGYYWIEVDPSTGNVTLALGSD